MVSRSQRDRHARESVIGMCQNQQSERVDEK